MGAIRILDEATVGQIAAGEVVERPASVVKELVENAIDAGATRIEVEIKNGGRSLIRVTDNGQGMDRDDLALAVQRHATSKIRGADDLNCLVTLGFRGEALPSIAAAANLEIASRRQGAKDGHTLVMENGRLKDIAETGLPEGTTVRVTDLFTAVPARLKYLKSIPTEAGYIADVLGRLAIAYPRISFRLLHHEYEILFTPGSGACLDAVTAIFGRDVARDLLPLEPAESGIGVSGFAGKPNLARASRNHELFYLNGRYIRSRLLGSAVEKAYHTLLPITRYPFAIIFLALEPQEADINVHPGKLEARFADEGAVYRAVFHAVRRTLASASLVFAWRGAGEPETAPAPPPAADADAASPAYAAASPGVLRLETADTVREGGARRFTALGRSLRNTYLLAEDQEGMLLVDQHAAHERVLYDRYCAREEMELGPQRLLIPATVNLSFQQARLMAERLPVFAGLGFVLEEFGPNTFLLRAMPAALARLDGARLVTDLLDELLHQPSVRDARSIREACLASMACHAAIKAGDALAPQEMQALLDDLALTANPFTCPHGRPTAIRLGWEEIGRRFRRR